MANKYCRESVVCICFRCDVDEYRFIPVVIRESSGRVIRKLMFCR